MARDYQQTDTVATCTGPANRRAINGGTPGTNGINYSQNGSDVDVIARLMEIAVETGWDWVAGDMTYRLNVTIANMNVTWTGLRVTRRSTTACNTTIETLADVTFGSAISLGTTGVKTSPAVALSAASAQGANDVISIEGKFSNGSMSAANWSWLSDQIINTPFTAVSGTTFPQSCGGTIGSTQLVGGLVRRANKLNAGGFTPSAILAKRANKANAGSLTFVGVTAKLVTKTPSGGLTLAGVLARTKVVFANTAGSLSLAASVVKKALKNPVGTVTTAGTMLSKSFKSLVATLTTAATLAKAANKNVSGSVSSSASVVKAIRKNTSGEMVPSGIITKLAVKAVVGGVTLAGVVSRRIDKLTAGAQTFAGGLLNRIDKAMSGSVDLSASLGAEKLTGGVFISAALTLAGSARSQINKLASGTLTTSGNLATLAGASVDISAVLTFVGDLPRRINKLTTGTIAPNGVVVRLANKITSGALAIDGAVQKLVNKVNGAALTFAGEVASRFVSLVNISAELTMGATLARDISKNILGQISMAGVTARQAYKSITASLAPSGALVALKALSISIAGTLFTSGEGVGVRGGTRYQDVGGEIGLRGRLLAFNLSHGLEQIRMLVRSSHAFSSLVSSVHNMLMKSRSRHSIKASDESE